MNDGPPILVQGLTFSYAGAARPALRDVHLEVPAGCRGLLVGRNGAGKSTLLRVLAGRHMVPADRVRVLGRAAFDDTSLTARVAFLGGRFPFLRDVRVAEILARRPGPPARQAELLALLEVDPAWHMDRISDGQRQRVQLLLGLLRPAEVLLLDEVTTDLDLLGRAQLLDFLHGESTARQATILYATHILEGLEEWATHLLLVHDGRLARVARLDELEELAALRRAGAPSPLGTLVRGWLRGG